VLPFEAGVVAAFKARRTGTPACTHSCGAMGDRLEPLEETGRTAGGGYVLSTAPRPQAPGLRLPSLG
jgi:hypothetical protein